MEEEIEKIQSKKRNSSYNLKRVELIRTKSNFARSKSKLHFESSKFLSWNTKKDLANYPQIDTMKSEINYNETDNNIEDNPDDKLITTLKNHFLFKDLSTEAINTIVQELIMYQFDKGDVLYNEGTDGCYFYILAQGSVTAFFEGSAIKTLHPWTCFGEVSLISRCTREETMKCETDVIVYVLDGEIFRNIIENSNKSKNKEVYQTLNNVSLFICIDNGYIHKLAQMIKSKTYTKGEVVIKEKENVDCLYIIASGTVSFIFNNSEIGTLRQFDFFGQRTLFFDNKKINNFTIISQADNTIIYSLSKLNFRTVIGENFKEILLFSLFKEFLSKDNYFKDLLYDSFIKSMFDIMTIRFYEYQEVIADPNKKIILVLEGNISHRGKNSTISQRGEILGTEQLGIADLSNSHISSPLISNAIKDIVGNPYLLCMEVDNQKIIDLLTKTIAQPKRIQSNFIKTNSKTINELTNSFANESNLKKPIEKTATAQVSQTQIKSINLYHRIIKLKQIYLFKNLSDDTLETIALHLHKKIYNPGQVIIEEDAYGDNFYVISKGKVCVLQKDKVIRELSDGSCFGEIALISDYEKRTATVVAINQVTCYLLAKNMFECIIDDNNIREYLRNKISLQDTSIVLKDLFIIKFLGSGKYGNVHLVHNQHNLYAIKSIMRKPADAQPILARYYKRERQVMMKLDHPFIVQMVKTMRNNYFCFFLLEYIDGINLDNLIEKKKLFHNIGASAFYIASIFLVLHYLHKKQIIHRDIKPSNIIISTTGYIKLIDFGAATIISDYSHSVIGTPFYISPEVLSGKEYTISCDYWSVGICFYEMIYGQYPFGNNADNILDIYKEIKGKQVSFPDGDSKFYDANNLIIDLLDKNNLTRPCSFQVLKDYSLFRGFPWNKLKDFKVKPPYQPKSHNWKKNMNLMNPYEIMINQTLSKSDKIVGEDTDKNRLWAADF